MLKIKDVLSIRKNENSRRKISTDSLHTTNKSLLNTYKDQNIVKVNWNPRLVRMLQETRDLVRYIKGSDSYDGLTFTSVSDDVIRLN